LRPYTKN